MEDKISATTMNFQHLELTSTNYCSVFSQMWKSNRAFLSTCSTTSNNLFFPRQIKSILLPQRADQSQSPLQIRTSRTRSEINLNSTTKNATDTWHNMFLTARKFTASALIQTSKNVYFPTAEVLMKATVTHCVIFVLSNCS